jgi:hypothetical protein
MNPRLVPVILALFSAAFVPAFSQTNNNERPIPRVPAKQELPDADRDFLRDAAAAEWRLQQIAAVAEDKVKGAGRSLASAFGRDNSKAVSGIENLSRDKGVVLPPRDNKVRSDWVRKGNFGDAEFVDAMVHELRSAVRTFEQGARSQDRQIAEFANKRLTELRRQFDSAHKAQLENIDRSRRR